MLPILDLSRLTDEPLASEWDRACRETGFLALVGHGLSAELIDETIQAAREFFSLPVEEKTAVSMPHPGYPYGYSGLAEENLERSSDWIRPNTGASRPDPKESLSIGPPGSWSPAEAERSATWKETPTQWPLRPNTLSAAFRAYYAETNFLAARLMELAARALGFSANYFAPFFDDSMSAFRALHYPEHPGLFASKKGDDSSETVAIRAGAHTDFGCLTLLMPERGSGGLQIQGLDERWIDVPAIDNAFVVNIGDLLSRWTNDRWISTKHRVIASAEAPPVSRLSLAFFYNPNPNAEIQCLETCIDANRPARYESVAAGKYLMGKYRRSVNGD